MGRLLGLVFGSLVGYSCLGKFLNSGSMYL